MEAFENKVFFCRRLSAKVVLVHEAKYNKLKKRDQNELNKS
jgi:hypothetical protein